MSQPLTQPTTQPEIVLSSGTLSAQKEIAHKLLSATKSASHDGHHKIVADQGHYHPELSTTGRGSNFWKSVEEVLDECSLPTDEYTK